MAEQVRTLELQRAQRALARGDDARAVVEQLSRAVTNKLIHAPTAGLKQASVDGRQDLLANARRLLGLPEYSSGEQSKPAAESEDESVLQAEIDETGNERGDRTLQ